MEEFGFWLANWFYCKSAQLGGQWNYAFAKISQILLSIAVAPAFFIEWCSHVLIMTVMVELLRKGGEVKR